MEHVIRVGERWFAATLADGAPGVWISDDDASAWSGAAPPPFAGQILGLAAGDDVLLVLVAGEDGGVWRLDDDRWDRLADAPVDTTLRSPLVLSEGELLVGTHNQGLLRLVPGR